MYKIGEFSILAKTTIKTLRYYEKEGLLQPALVDKNTGYRYYQTTQLLDLAKIISLRQIGLSIEEIKNCQTADTLIKILENRKKIIEEAQQVACTQLFKINYLLEEKFMNYEIITKELPAYNVYYKEGTIKSFNDITDFILTSAEECLATNPNLKCISPDYCYINYLDKEFKDHDITIRYAQAVEKIGIPNNTIHFTTLRPVTALCTYHQGCYDNLKDAYSFLLNYIEKNHYEILEAPRERYIDGIWNQKEERNWLTEIQIPIKKK